LDRAGNLLLVDVLRARMRGPESYRAVRGEWEGKPWMRFPHPWTYVLVGYHGIDQPIVQDWMARGLTVNPGRGVRRRQTAGGGLRRRGRFLCAMTVLARVLTPRARRCGSPELANMAVPIASWSSRRSWLTRTALMPYFLETWLVRSPSMRSASSRRSRFVQVLRQAAKSIRKAASWS
jgi:hypothetical protein